MRASALWYRQCLYHPLVVHSAGFVPDSMIATQSGTRPSGERKCLQCRAIEIHCGGDSYDASYLQVTYSVAFWLSKSRGPDRPERKIAPYARRFRARFAPLFPSPGTAEALSTSFRRNQNRIVYRPDYKKRLAILNHSIDVVSGGWLRTQQYFRNKDDSAGDG
jgi:hypothetical protein